MVNTGQWTWSAPRPTGNLSLGKILRNAAIAYPRKGVTDATLVVSRTYREMDERASRIANGLLDSGLKPGDIVTVLARNNIETLEVYFACARAGLILMPVSFRLLPNEIEMAMRHVGAKNIIYDERFKGIVDGIGLELNRYVIGEGGGGAIGYDELLKHDSRDPELEIRDDTLVTLGFTSGTTGMPKVFMRTHYSNFNNHVCGVLSFDLNSLDTGLTAIPPLTGVTWTVSMMLARADAVVMDFDPVKMLEAVEKYRVTTMFCVPAMFKALLDVPDLEKYDLSSLRAVASVGSFLPIPVLEGIWKKITPNVYDEFGLQEVGYVSVIKPDMKRAKPASAGPPVPMQEIRIVDDEGRDLPRGEVGEVIVRTADSAGEYWKNEAKTRESYKNGWFYTGDLGRFDEDGYLYIVGRKKDMIVTGGYNVYASDVEDVILGNPGVADCAVVGLPDEKWGEAVSAVVVLKQGESLAAEELIAYCRERLANYKVPKRVFFTGAIPRTLSGKAMKFKIVEHYSGR